MLTRVILDTDIGTDVDDCLALAVLLGSPELQLEGVTTVYGDTLLRSRMVMKLLRLRGREEIPVYAGATHPLMPHRPVNWAGHEGRGLLTNADNALTPRPDFGPNFIVRTVMDSPGQIHLLAIGPLTNVALAFIQEPKLAKSLARLTIMGAVVRGPGNLHLPYAEWNIICDPEAANIVFTSGAPIRVVPLDLTVQVQIDRTDLQKLRLVGTPFHRAVAQQLSDYPNFARFGTTSLHDPLAAATLIRPDLVTFENLHLDVETEGRHTTGATLVRLPHVNENATGEVGLAVNVQAAHDFVVSRLIS